jgi:phage I-like protein
MLDKELLLDIKDGITLSTNDPLVFEKQVIYVGDFTKRNPATGDIEYQFSVDEATIDHWVNTHTKLVGAGLDVPMPEGHTEESSKRKATALELSKKPDSKGRTSLFAKLKFKDLECAKTFKDSQVSLYSPPVVYHQDLTLVRPIRHICFTDYPVVGGLDPLTTIAASYDNRSKEKSMLKELAKKLGIALANDTMTDLEISAVIEKDYADKAALALANPPAAPAAPVSGNQADPLKITTQENRNLKIDNLVLSHKITTAEAKEMKALWAGDTLALSAESTAAFETLIKTFQNRKEIVALSGEKSGSQKPADEDSPLVADAKARAKAHS